MTRWAVVIGCGLGVVALAAALAMWAAYETIGGVFEALAHGRAL